MKTKFFGIIALIAVIVISMAACDNGSNDNNNGDSVPLIMGKFASQTGSGNAVFYADIDNTARSARAVTADETLAGKIEDGDIIFNLKGTYFPSTGDFVLSAGSSFLVYQIEGSVKNEKLEQAEATVKVLTDGTWVAHTVSVTATTNANDVTITGTVSNDQQDGIPQKWLGKWIMSMETWEDGADEPDFEDVDFIISPYAMLMIGNNDFDLPLDVLEVKIINSTTVECVLFGMGGASACGSSDPNDPVCNAVWKGDCSVECACKKTEGFCDCGDFLTYMKITLKESGNNLVFSMYEDAFIEADEPNALATVRDYNTATADPDDIYTISMRR